MGRGINHSRGLGRLGVTFWEAHRSWRLSQGRGSPEWFADESKKERQAKWFIYISGGDEGCSDRRPGEFSCHGKNSRSQPWEDRKDSSVTPWFG